MRRVVTSMPERSVDIVGLRSELAKALLGGSNTLFHLFKLGRDFALRPAETTCQRPELVDRAWFKDKITGNLFEMGWCTDGKPMFIRAVDKANQPAQPSPQRIAGSGHGGNVELRALVTEPTLAYCRPNFRFALLEHRPSRTDDKIILDRETFWKRILGTRGELNRN